MFVARGQVFCLFNLSSYSRYRKIFCDPICTSRQYKYPHTKYSLRFICFSYLITGLLQASSLAKNPKIDAFWAGVWAWKAFVFRLRAKGASSVLVQWADMYICSTSDTLSLLMPTLVRWSPSMVFVWQRWGIGQRSSLSLVNYYIYQHNKVYLCIYFQQKNQT